MPQVKPDINPQPLPPAADSPSWWPQLLWQLHGVRGPGIGPINYPPAIDNLMANLHIHTMSYLMEDQQAAQQIRNLAEQQMTSAVKGLSRAHEQAAGSAG
jgi:hypothetical protein